MENPTIITNDAIMVIRSRKYDERIEQQAVNAVCIIWYTLKACKDDMDWCCRKPTTIKAFRALCFRGDAIDAAISAIDYAIGLMYRPTPGGGA